MVFSAVITLVCVAALYGLTIMSVGIVSLIYEERKLRTKRAKTYGYDLVKIAGELDPVIGRDKEIQSLVTILSGKTMNNPVLIGEPGVGKTAVVRGLAQRIVGKQVPGNLRNVKLITLDIGALVTGTKFRGQFEKWLKEVEGARGRIILFIEDIHLVLGGGCIDASNLFKPMLARGRVRCIGTTTPEGYQKYIGKVAAFEGRIQPVYLDEPSVADTCRILHDLKAKYEDYHGVRILDRALASAAQLSSRYITWRRLPDKAIDLVDEACAKIKVKLNSHHQEPVGPEQIAEVVSHWTGIRVINLGQNEEEQRLGLVDKLHKRIVGQDEAVQAVAEAVLRLGAGFGKSQKPAGSFLFLGPTGVGKTELAKALAAELFDHEDHLIRIDMSEYMVLHSVSKLIGAPPGSSGHEEVGQLTEAVRQRPYSVVLFDEVEKAHKSVLNILLQVLDDGRLTDGQGRTVSFSNTIIIMTSNLGTEPLLAALSGHTTIKTAREKVMQEVRSHFRPEMLNRIDKIQMFDLISGDELKKVAKLQMKDLEIRLRQRGAMQLKVTDAALDFILDNAGYDPVYGARSLQRWLDKNVVTKLSSMLINREIYDSVVYIDAIPGQQTLDIILSGAQMKQKSQR